MPNSVWLPVYRWMGQYRGRQWRSLEHSRLRVAMSVVERSWWKGTSSVAARGKADVTPASH